MITDKQVDLFGVHTLANIPLFNKDDIFLEKQYKQSNCSLKCGIIFIVLKKKMQ